MSSHNFKHDLLARFGHAGKALRNSILLKYIVFIADDERSVNELSSVSGLVGCRKERLKLLYSLSGVEVITLLNDVRVVTERGREFQGMHLRGR